MKNESVKRLTRLGWCMLIAILIIPLLVLVSWVKWRSWPHLYWWLLPGAYLTDGLRKVTGLASLGEGLLPWVLLAVSNAVFWTVLLYLVVSFISRFRRGNGGERGERSAPPPPDGP
jgi:hypothetical protein